MSNQTNQYRERAAELRDLIAKASEDEKFGELSSSEYDETTIEALLDFAQQVAAESAPQWISVKERLPEVPPIEARITFYWVAGNGGYPGRVHRYPQPCYLGTDKRWRFACDDTLAEDAPYDVITHWMAIEIEDHDFEVAPLPPAPEKGEGE